MHGAAGAAGSMATQLAREYGAYVIGTGRAAHRQTALDFGAQEFVDLENGRNRSQHGGPFGEFSRVNPALQCADQRNATYGVSTAPKRTQRPHSTVAPFAAGGIQSQPKPAECLHTKDEATTQAPETSKGMCANSKGLLLMWSRGHRADCGGKRRPRRKRHWGESCVTNFNLISADHDCGKGSRRDQWLLDPPRDPGYRNQLELAA